MAEVAAVGLLSINKCTPSSSSSSSSTTTPGKPPPPPPPLPSSSPSPSSSSSSTSSSSLLSSILINSSKNVTINDVAILENEIRFNDTKSLWIFAYGSLCWRPGFKFNKAITGYVEGFQRRFWQGNTTHRGTEQKPGRVATLVENKNGMVCGVAFSINDEAALPYLSKRECELGGYMTNFSTFYPLNGKPFKVLLYTATPGNRLWLGDGNLKDIARQIINTSGPSGHNVEYLIRLANFMRHHFPYVNDQHLFHLENEVLKQINEKNICIDIFMGDGNGCITFIKQKKKSSSRENYRELENTQYSQFSKRIPKKTLRCLNL